MIYFHRNNISSSTDLKNNVEIFVSVNSPNESSYTCELFMNNDVSQNKFNKVGVTEPSQGKEYKYNTTFFLEYFFELQQNLRLVISQNGSFKEEKLFTLGNLMGSRNNTYNATVGDSTFSLQGKKVQNDRINVRFGISNSGLNKKFKHCFFILSNCNDNVTWRKVYKSEEREENAKYDPLEIESSALCLGDLNKKIQIEFYDADTYQIIDKGTFHVNEYIDSRSLTLESGSVLPTMCETVKTVEFVDYLQMGLQVSLVVGVDFTLSNGEPSNPGSLHYINGNVPNEYEMSIRQCGSIVAYYDYDHKFPLLGFGGIPQGKQNVEHVFPLNNDYTGSPEVGSIEEMISVYKNAVLRTTLHGPTNFAPLIRNTSRICSNTGTNSYYILLILTDGVITDKDETISAIIEASRINLSIIIIGVGKANFNDMETLDGDEIPLSNSKGMVLRDIVQFVEFNKYRNNPQKLAEEVLKEIPKQVEDFYRGNRFN